MRWEGGGRGGGVEVESGIRRKKEVQQVRGSWGGGM